jgi:hypothetical protein
MAPVAEYTAVMPGRPLARMLASLTPATIDISGEPVTVLRGHGHTQPAPPATGFPYHAIPSPATTRPVRSQPAVRHANRPANAGA